MRKSSSLVPMASQFEFLRAIGEDGDDSEFISPKLYAVDGTPGIFRRVKREGRGLNKLRDNTILATFDGSVIELSRDKRIDYEIIAAFPHNFAANTLSAMSENLDKANQKAVELCQKIPVGYLDPSLMDENPATTPPEILNPTPPDESVSASATKPDESSPSPIPTTDQPDSPAKSKKTSKVKEKV